MNADFHVHHKSSNPDDEPIGLPEYVHQIVCDLREMKDELIGQIYVAENDPECGITDVQLNTLKMCLAETEIAILAWLDED